MFRRHFTVSLLLILCTGSFGLAAGPKKILLLGGDRDHPAASHEYMAGLKVLAKSLEGIDGLELSIHNADEPWPQGPELLKDANPEAQKLVRDAIAKGMTGPDPFWKELDRGTRVNTGSYGPTMMELVRHHRGMDRVKRDMPQKCKPFPLEDEFREQFLLQKNIQTLFTEIEAVCRQLNRAKEAATYRKLIRT